MGPGRGVSMTAATTASYRPAVRPRRFRYDDMTALDMFSGFGGLTQGIEIAGFSTIMAANHNRYKVEVHEANHPASEHFIADLVNPEVGDYHDARDLPPADLLAAGVSCVNHSQANTQKAYEEGLTLFDLDDTDYEDRVTRSERDRATANCVLHYAQAHHPLVILIECTTELQSWGYLVPGSKKIGDGTTYRWWLSEFVKLGYRYRELYLNSMFFGVPQSRDRLYICMWDAMLPSPDLDHRPLSLCTKCDTVVEGVWTWRTGIPASGSVRYGRQYNYRCPSCRSVVLPAATPSIYALDLTDLGTRIGDRKKPLAATTMARGERCRQRFPDFPAVLMPVKATHGSERHPWQPMATQTSQQETALLSTGAIMQTANSFEHPGSECRTRDLTQPLWTQPATNSTALLTPPVALAVDNFQGSPRGVDKPLPTQGGSETMAIVSAGILPYRKNTVPPTHMEAMPTVTSEQIPGLITAAGLIQQNEGVDRRVFGTGDPLRTVTANNQFGLVSSGSLSLGGRARADSVLDPVGIGGSTNLLASEWRAALAEITIEDCYFRMLGSHEVGRGCGFDVDFPDHQGSFVVWGSERDRVDGYGNAVSPQVGAWLGGRLRAVLHGEGELS